MVVLVFLKTKESLFQKEIIMRSGKFLNNEKRFQCFKNEQQQQCLRDSKNYKIEITKSRCFKRAHN